MSERTGLGVVDIAILEALDTSQYLRCSKALARVEERIGLAPGYAYQVLVDLARPWTMPINLVHGQGQLRQPRQRPSRELPIHPGPHQPGRQGEGRQAGQRAPAPAPASTLRQGSALHGICPHPARDPALPIQRPGVPGTGFRCHAGLPGQSPRGHPASWPAWRNA